MAPIHPIPQSLYPYDFPWTFQMPIILHPLMYSLLLDANNCFTTGESFNNDPEIMPEDVSPLPTMTEF